MKYTDPHLGDFEVKDRRWWCVKPGERWGFAPNSGPVIGLFGVAEEDWQQVLELVLDGYKMGWTAATMMAAEPV
jgi:hypothetical protein